MTDVNSVQGLCNLAFTYSSRIVPFKCRFGSAIHPSGTTAWIKGFIILQNSNYDYPEIGTIYATTASNTYRGYITASNGSPNNSISWLDVNERIQSTDNWIEAKIRHEEGNIQFHDAGGTSYGYLTINGANNPTTGNLRPPRLINAYISEINEHVDWRISGFTRKTESASQSTYTLWTNFSFNGNVWCQWCYMLI